MTGYWFRKLADLLEADAKEREDAARAVTASALGEAHTGHAVTGRVVTDVMPALTIAATLRAIAGALRKVGAS